MQTVYDQIIKCRELKRETFNDAPLLIKVPYFIDNTLVEQKLADLLHLVYDISNIDENILFKPGLLSVDKEISIAYRFKDFTAHISTNDDKLIITFFHDAENIKTAFQTDRCIVNVDHDLNLIQAEYSTYFAFINRIYHKKSNYAGYNHMKISRIINKTESYNQLSFHHSDDESDLFSAVHPSRIDKRFSIPNTELEDTFIKMIDRVTDRPHSFCQIFDKYPSFVECVKSSDAVIEFVNLFVHQYFDENEHLKQNILLLDMLMI